MRAILTVQQGAVAMSGRGIQLFLVLAVLAAVYALGFWQGSSRLNESPVATVVNNTSHNGISPPTQDIALEQATTPDSSEVFATLLENGAWFALERWFDERAQSVSKEQGMALVNSMSRQVNKYDALAMRSVLRAYLDQQSDDIQALFLLSDLQQVSGLREGALETLFSLLAQPLEPVQYARAKRAAEQIINVIDNELRTRGALAERAAFWQHVSLRVPASDLFRYQWARALAQYKQHDEALHILAQTGTSDVSQDELDTLEEQILQAQTTITFRKDGDRLLSAAVAPTGLAVTLLVDTGANVTSLTRSALRSLAARRLPEEATVRTAGGLVTTGIYTVPEILVEGRVFTDLRVLELPVNLPGIDGLLGTDLLRQLRVDPLAVQTP
ncbi:MAG: aspartyl protease family protein [Pseudomonadaceae bacterium]|nr:aspartyl protease family protein [Pseudomonadaceae bacterium]